MITGVINNDCIGEPDNHRTTTSAATATVNLGMELLLTITFSSGFKVRLGLVACSRLG